MTDLRQGRGVVVAATYDEAEAALRDMLLDASFGKGRVVVEDFLSPDPSSRSCVCSVGREGVSTCCGSGP